MAAYLVRLKQDQKSPRDLVGIFVASSIDELEGLVDECCDTFAGNAVYERKAPPGRYAGPIPAISPERQRKPILGVRRKVNCPM